MNKLMNKSHESPKLYKLCNFGLKELTEKEIKPLVANRSKLGGHCRCGGTGSGK